MISSFACGFPSHVLLFVPVVLLQNWVLPSKNRYCIKIGLCPIGPQHWHVAVNAPRTTYGKLWNLSFNSFPLSLIYTTFPVSASTVCTVISSWISVVHSVCSCVKIYYSSSNCSIICVAWSWRGSTFTCLSCFYICVAFNSDCKLFISWVPFRCCVMLIVFSLCLRYCLGMLSLYFSWSHCWTYSSSSNSI